MNDLTTQGTKEEEEATPLPLPITWTQADFDSLDPQLQQAYAAYIAQLKFTIDQLQHQTTDHIHYTDDCGDDLSAALEISAKLQPIDGIHSLIANFASLDLNDYADAAPEVFDYARDFLNYKDEE